MLSLIAYILSACASINGLMTQPKLVNWIPWALLFIAVGLALAKVGL